MGPETARDASARVDKHTALQEQFKNVKQVADELQVLINKVRGEDLVDPPSLVNQSDAKVAQIREPCLTDVLCMGADELQEQCNRMRDQIRTLHDVLF